MLQQLRYVIKLRYRTSKILKLASNNEQAESLKIVSYINAIKILHVLAYPAEAFVTAH